MYKARKRNRVLRIPTEKVEEYKKMGYTISDLDGNIIYEVKDDATKNAELERENARLKQKITEYELILAQKGLIAKPEGKEQVAEAEPQKKGKTTKTKAE